MPLIDPVQLQQMTAGDDDLLADLAIMFVKLLPEIESQVRLGVQQRDAQAVESAAHQLKSRVGYFGAAGVGERARGLESAAQNNELQTLPSLVDALFDDIDRLIVELSAMTGLSLERDAE